MSLEQPSSSEKGFIQAEQFLAKRIYDDKNQLQKEVDRLKTLNVRGDKYDPLNEGVEIYDETGEDITPEHPENITQQLTRQNAQLEKLSQISDFWYYYIVTVSEWNSE